MDNQSDMNLQIKTKTEWLPFIHTYFKTHKEYISFIHKYFKTKTELLLKSIHTSILKQRQNYKHSQIDFKTTIEWLTFTHIFEIKGRMETKKTFHSKNNSAINSLISFAFVYMVNLVIFLCMFIDTI